MKKLLSLVLAAAMVLTLSAVAFATTTIPTEEQVWGVDSDYYYTLSDGYIKSTSNKKSIEVPIPYGKTVYFALFCEDNGEYTGAEAKQLVVDYDVVKGINPKMDYEMGGSMIDSVTIVKKKQAIADGSTTFYAYFLAVKVKSSTSTSTTDVIGEITMKKSGQVRSTDLTEGADFSITLGYAKAYDVDDTKNYMDIISDTYRVYEFDTKVGTAYPYEDEEYELELDGDAGYFVVNTVGQGDLVLYCDVDFDSDVAALYPDANLDFVNGNGASFNKTGELYLYADEGSFLYTLKADGTLAAAKAEYDEYEEAFLVKTRTLGSYVISDVELDLAPVVVEPTEPAATEPTTPANPATGAVA